MGKTMITLGTVRFDAMNSPIDNTDRTSSYNWSVQDTLTGNPVSAYNSISAEAITISGTLHPTYRGKMQTLDDLRTLASSGKPQTLTASTGEVMGQWTINSIRNANTQLLPNGTATKVTFTVELMRYYND